MKSRLTHHSEYGKIRSMMIKPVANAFKNQDQINQQWQSLNFLAAPEYDQALIEYAELEKIFQQQTDQLHYLPVSHEKVTLDDIYCRDASIVTDHGIILCNMGKASRADEPQMVKEYCIQHKIHILGQVEYPGTIEGGDLAWIDENTLAIGHTYRTNLSGINQVKNFLSPFDINIITADLPHYKGINDVFHLMSIFSPVDRDVAVVYSPLMPISFRNELLDRSFHLVEVSDDEFESMACNVLAIAPRKCIIMDNNPKIHHELLKVGCELITYQGKNISYLGGGGPTCLTRPMLREITDTGFG